MTGPDHRAYQVANELLGTREGLLDFRVARPYSDEDLEALRQFLLKHGATEDEGPVVLCLEPALPSPG